MALELHPTAPAFEIYPINVEAGVWNFKSFAWILEVWTGIFFSRSAAISTPEILYTIWTNHSLVLGKSAEQTPIRMCWSPNVDWGRRNPNYPRITSAAGLFSIFQSPIQRRVFYTIYSNFPCVKLSILASIYWYFSRHKCFNLCLQSCDSSIIVWLAKFLWFICNFRMWLK